MDSYSVKAFVLFIGTFYYILLETKCECSFGVKRVYRSNQDRKDECGMYGLAGFYDAIENEFCPNLSIGLGWRYVTSEDFSSDSYEKEIIYAMIFNARASSDASALDLNVFIVSIWNSTR